nr:hypothetical protein HmN_000599000 [Hymenolepis microstoma]
MDAVKVKDVFGPFNEEKNPTTCNRQGTPRPRSFGSYRKVSKLSFEEKLNLDGCSIPLKRPRRNSKSSNVIVDKELGNPPKFVVTNLDSRDEDDIPRTRRNGSKMAKIVAEECSVSQSTEIISKARKNPTRSDSFKGDFSCVNCDLPKARRHRKSSITNNAVDDRVGQTTEMVPIGIIAPTDEASQELPEWLQNKITDSSLKSLDTIFEDRLLDKNKRIPPVRSKRSNFSTPSRVTRRSTLVKSSPVANEVNSLSRNCLPRQLVFVTWEEMYPSEREDENWKKFLVKSMKDKRRSHISKLRSMNKRPGDAFRVSEETEKRLEEFWAKMRDDL